MNSERESEVERLFKQLPDGFYGWTLKDGKLVCPGAYGRRVNPEEEYEPSQA